MSNYPSAPVPQQRRSPWPMISFGLLVVLVVAACVIALLIHNQRGASGAPVAVSADQQLVTELNAIKARYPQDTSAKVTLGTLPAFLQVGCSVISSGLGSTPEWKDFAALLAQTKKCPASVNAAADQPDNSATHPLAWGATYHGSNIDITVSAPASFTPTASAFSGGATGKDVAVTITLANHGTTAINPSGILIVQGTSGQAEASEVVDDNIGEPTADVLPGKTLVWKHGFVVPPTATDLSVGVGLLGGQTVYFTGVLR